MVACHDQMVWFSNKRLRGSLCVTCACVAPLSCKSMQVTYHTLIVRSLSQLINADRLKNLLTRQLICR